MIKGNIMNNYYVRFVAHSYHGCRETIFNSLVEVKLKSLERKCGSRAPGHSVGLKGML